MSYSIDVITDDCYDGTTCLINKLDIKDEKQLKIVEAHKNRLNFESVFQCVKIVLL